MKDINKMQKPMRDASYHYCSLHDIYFDEWLDCPACALAILLNNIIQIQSVISRVKKLVDKFNPEDRG
jgi:hypothetical protein